MLLADLLFPWLSSFDLNEIGVLDDSLSLQLTATPTEAACPCCAQASLGVHSRYQRRLVDLPCAGLPVALHLAVRKFFCRNPACPQVVFSERIGEVAAPYARRTLRLRQEQASLGFDLGGEAGARTAQRQGMPVSADTLLRLIRQTPPPAYATPRVLGVDDWALRKGQVYGTILVDLEQHQPVDLRSDRSATTLEQWLKAHPGVEVISRDRANDYAEGASRGAPSAVQVADRFHLLQNVREMLQRLLERHQAALRAATAVPTPVVPTAPTSVVLKPGEPAVLFNQSLASLPPCKEPPVAPTPRTKTAAQQAARRQRRIERYPTVRNLAASGLSLRQIAQQLALSYRTVRKFACADQFPEQATRRSIASKLDPFLPVLRQALAAGQDNAMQLWRHLRDDLGDTGSRALVSRWVAHHRHLCPPPSPDQPRPTRRGKPPTTTPPTPAPQRLSARQAAWLLVRPPETLDEQERQLLARLGHVAPEVQTAYMLAQVFIRMVRHRTNANFEDWLARSEATAIPELQAFAAGLRRDKSAVGAAPYLAL